jgi:hypothetical protein
METTYIHVYKLRIDYCFQVKTQNMVATRTYNAMCNKLKVRTTRKYANNHK